MLPDDHSTADSTSPAPTSFGWADFDRPGNDQRHRRRGPHGLTRARGAARRPRRREIVDLGSSNGTFVNGHRVGRALLNRGDLVGIGHHVFTLGDGVLVEHVDTGDVAFEVDAISVDAGETRLLHDMTFRLPGRALLAVLGPSGAGKSTLLNALTGFRPANVGTVRFGGRDLYAQYDELRRKIGYVPQDDILHTSLTVREALEFGAKLRFPADTTDAERRARIEEVLVELALTSRPSDGAPPAAGLDAPAARPAGNDLADRQVSKLFRRPAQAHQRRLELLTQPTLLYLDELTSGLTRVWTRR
jgi:ABC-type branched-subunit amino acid transport system ATPase component